MKPSRKLWHEPQGPVDSGWFATASFTVQCCKRPHESMSTLRELTPQRNVKLPSLVEIRSALYVDIMKIPVGTAAVEFSFLKCLFVCG
jgi:hypothetical protein